VSSPYEIRVAGQLDETAAIALAGLDISARGADTIITGEFDQAALHGLLNRLTWLGLDLMEARRIHGLRRTRQVAWEERRPGRSPGDHSQL
jgi:hypothetical protein